MNRSRFNRYSTAVTVHVISTSREESFETKDGCKSSGRAKNGVKAGTCFHPSNQQVFFALYVLIRDATRASKLGKN